jgi:DNA-directed RNA polymerase subunit RPC12/RpoP
VRLGFSSITLFGGQVVVPQYNFLCRACNKEFSKILTISEYEKGGIVCPHCKKQGPGAVAGSLLCGNLEEELEEILDTELDPGLTLFRGEEVYEACKTKAAEEDDSKLEGCNATP